MTYKVQSIVQKRGFVAYLSKATATRDFSELVEHYEIFKKKGKTGAGTEYNF